MEWICVVVVNANAFHGKPRITATIVRIGKGRGLKFCRMELTIVFCVYIKYSFWRVSSVLYLGYPALYMPHL